MKNNDIQKQDNKRNKNLIDQKIKMYIDGHTREEIDGNSLKLNIYRKSFEKDM